MLDKVNREDPEQLFDDSAGLTRVVIRSRIERTAASIYQELDHRWATPATVPRLSDPDLAATEIIALTGLEVLVRMRVEGVGRERWEFDWLDGGMILKQAEVS